MPTTTTSIVGDCAQSLSGSALHPDQTIRFTTTDATPNNYDFTVADPPLGPVASAYMIKVEWCAVGSGSESAGVSYAAYYDNGSAVSLIGSSAPLSSGSASLFIGTTGSRTMHFVFTGLALQTLNWTVKFTISRQ
jgi:hypothetical protein